MDSTLAQVLQRLYELDLECAQQKIRIAELEMAGQQQVADLTARLHTLEQQPPVKDS